MKSRMPEIVEPKQLIQSRVLVKRARLTVKRGAARPIGKSTGNLSHLRVRSEGPSGIEYEAQPGIRHKTTKEEDGGGERKTKGQRADLAKGVGS